ncbi:hypothetical protein [Lentzea californiensis]|uniref:hypothetical protein n=1 Tax=Lentzea californiensis TaxID=438851 RepID=UPI002165C578|nr:hypothetical protein [Lentzea californiensis]
MATSTSAPAAAVAIGPNHSRPARPRRSRDPAAHSSPARTDCSNATNGTPCTSSLDTNSLSGGTHTTASACGKIPLAAQNSLP